MATTFDYRRTKPLKTATIAVAVTPGQRDEIYTMLRESGFTYPSEAMRALLLAYARDEAVRDAVMAWHTAQPPLYDR